MKQKSSLRRVSLITALVLTAALIVSPFVAVLAEDGSDAYINCTDQKGEYTYVSNENCVSSNTDEYRYNDAWFSGSSFEMNRQLATLSSIAAITSASYYTALDERDNSQNSKNLEAFLRDIGFEDVTANTAYNSEKLPYGAGVCVGHKTIEAGGKEYTLLAVIPRSAGYKQEWVGNFDVDNANDTHYGFKAGRDEILRFVKKYIQDNAISGDLKIWMAGHSRGAALTNITAAFFACGTDYFGTGVSIAPENVYAYTFATPRTAVSGENGDSGEIIKGDFLSVRGNSGGRYAGYDTEMEPYLYSGSDMYAELNMHASEFGGIYNCAPGYDIITLLPLKQWDYGYFGSEFPITDGSGSTKEEMLSFLQKVSPYAYGRYTAEGATINCDSDGFTWLTFDVDSLSVVEDTEYQKDPDQAVFYYERIAGLFSNALTPSDYANHDYETALMALAGIYGMGIDDFAAGFISDLPTLIEGGVLAYLDYAATAISAERGVSYEKGISAAFEELLTFANGGALPEGVTRSSDGEITVDGAVYVILRYVMDRAVETEVDGKTQVTFPEDEKLAKMLYDLIMEQAGSMQTLLWGLLKSGAYGYDHTAEDPDLTSASTYRQTIYGLLPVFLSDYKDIFEKVLGTDSPYGTKPARELLGIIMNDGENLPQAADRYLTMCIENGVSAGLSSGRYDEGTDFYNDYASFGATMTEKVAVLRNLILDGLFYTEGKNYSAEDDVRSACSFVMQTGRLALAHYNELYIAWMKAQDPAYDSDPGHAMTHYAEVRNCEAEGNVEYWKCEKCGKYFLDENGGTETTENDVKILPTGHAWGEWMTLDVSETGAPGTERRICANDPTHVETRSFSYDVTEGDGQKWARDKAKDITFVFERSVDDEATFERFAGIQIDGKDIDASMYTATAGSVEITLDSALLATLENGGHTLTAVFAEKNARAGGADAEGTPAYSRADAHFRIVDETVPVPLTGVQGRITVFAVLALIATVMIFVIRRRREA